MNSAPAIVVALLTVFATIQPISAQPSVRPWNDCLATEIQDRLMAQQPVRLSADKISLEGDTLRLTGNARVRFDDTTVIAEEVIINQSSKQVDFTRVRRIDIGSGSRCAPPPSAFPKIEYR